MDRGAWQATGHGVAKESDLATKQQQQQYILYEYKSQGLTWQSSG